jgi:uncharacterized protein (TIGR02231 family)
MADTIVIEAPVVRVTLLEDRAHVVRRGWAELPAGAVRVAVDDVSPVISDKTLTAVAAGTLTVDARVTRRARSLALDPEGEDALAIGSGRGETALRAALRDADAAIAALEGREAIMVREAEGLARTAGETMADLAADAGWGRAVADTTSTSLDAIAEREAEIRRRLHDLGQELEDARGNRQRLSRRLDALATPSSRHVAALEADLVVEAAGSHEITFEYIVPGACWRPYHTAELIGGEGDGRARLVFSTDACVWQSTGEPWNEAKLAFSTERASLGVDPPELASDILAVAKKAEAIAVEARDQEIQTTGLGGEVQIAPQVPGIDDGGEPIALEAAHPATVPSDGKPYRVRLGSFESDADVGLVAMPELSPCVFVRAEPRNAGAGPILAGPVDLVRKSGLVGRTSVLYIAAGERFELGFGPDADLRVKRDEQTSNDESRLLSSWISRKHEIALRLSNLGARTRTIEVKERIPVSEIDKVEIELDARATTGGRRPDEHGRITWTVKLPPRGRERLDLVYTLRKHEDVVGI